MENKKIMIGTILLLFVISGICNVISVSAGEVELSPLSYSYVSYTLEYRDELKLSVSSSGVINTYIMNEEQIDTLTDSGGLTWNYLKRWKDMTYLDYTYTIPADGMYSIVLYNKDIFYGRTVDFEIAIDYYYEPIDPFDPYDEPTENIFWNLLIFVIIPIVAIILVITVPIIIIRRHKKKTPKETIIIQERRVPKNIYCPECGAEILDRERMFCSKCGSKIIK